MAAIFREAVRREGLCLSRRPAERALSARADGRRMTSNYRAGIVFAQPNNRLERVGVAEKCCQSLAMSMPLLVDDISDRTGHVYSGMPDRLFVIDRSGRIAYKGGRGPFGFKP